MRKTSPGPIAARRPSCPEPTPLNALARPAALFGGNLSAALIAGLAAAGWAHAEQAIEPELIDALNTDLDRIIEADAIRAARIGRGEVEMKAPRIRKTQIAWMDGSSQAQRDFLAGADAMRLEINRRLFLGLFEFEAHYALYPEGGFYARHLDAFAGGPRARVVSMVAYLNRGWGEQDGGELAVWRDPRDEGDPVALIRPEAGSVVVMLSEEIPHAVRAARRDRRAIAGWWRVNPGVGGALDPAA